MGKYELMLVVKPDKAAEAAEKLDLIESFIEKEGGGIEEFAEWGERDLAYKIADYDRGDYRVWTITLPGNQLKELEERLRLSDYLIRYLVIRKD